MPLNNIIILKNNYFINIFYSPWFPHVAFLYVNCWVFYDIKWPLVSLPFCQYFSNTCNIRFNIWQISLLNSIYYKELRKYVNIVHLLFSLFYIIIVDFQLYVWRLLEIKLEKYCCKTWSFSLTLIFRKWIWIIHWEYFDLLYRDVKDY